MIHEFPRFLIDKLPSDVRLHRSVKKKKNTYITFYQDSLNYRVALVFSGCVFDLQQVIQSNPQSSLSVLPET